MAACTTNVSCLVDERKFDQVFNWLQDQKMIDEYTSTKLDWFSKNKYLIEQLKSKLSVGNEDEHNISLFVWQVYDKIINTFNLKKQVVKYGPPGTGKTYLAKKKNKLLFNIWKNEFANCSTFDIDDHNTIVQFHPSFTYEDFIEGLKPVQVGKSTTALKLTNGIFKSFCKKAARWEIDIQNLKDKGVHIPYDWDDIDVAFVKRIESQIKEKEHEHWEFVFTLDAKYDNLKLTDVVPPYFFIIDEINRAEISRVFGELMFCLEYRGYKDGSIKTQYSQLNDNETGMIKKNDQYYFFIPHNVYIIGTMNNIDRSVDTFDFALRRRFRWEEMIPDIEVLKFHLGKINNEWVELANNLDALNDAIIQENELLGSDYQIGHAYLWDLDKYYSDKQKVSSIRKMVWENNIEPILKEYIRGTGKEKDLIPKFAAKFGIK
jgi:5-methylcytosine-specific restriction protein B